MKRASLIVNLILWLCCFKNVADAEQNTSNIFKRGSLPNHNLLMGVMSTRNQFKSATSVECLEQLQVLEENVLLKQAWAFKMLDASGSPSPGFMFGNNFWLGNRELCEAVSHSLAPLQSPYVPHRVKPSVLYDPPPYAVNYRVVYVQHNSSWQIDFSIDSLPPLIHVGLCLPAGCSNEDMKLLMGAYIESDRFVDLFELQAQVVYVKDLKLKEDFWLNPALSVLLAFVAFSFVMVGLAMLRRVCYGENYEGKMRKVNEFIKCFDVMTNLQSLYDFEGSQKSQFPLISTIRGSYAILVCLGHGFYFLKFTSNSSVLVMKNSSVFGNVPVFVDAFYVISGFLQCYNFLHNPSKVEQVRKYSLRQSIMGIFTLFFHRLMRLVPLYFITTLLTYLMYLYMSDVSVFHTPCSLYENCERYWWRVALFIQNWYQDDEICLIWSWSLGIEVYYSLFITCLLFIYVKHPRFVKLVTVLLLPASFAWTIMKGFEHNYQLKIDSVFNTLSDLYMHPLMRLSAFIMGSMFGGYFAENPSAFAMTEGSGSKWLFDKAFYVFLAISIFKTQWNTSVAMAITILMGQRIVYAVVICWGIIGNKLQYSNWWLRLLTLRFFYHLNKLGYGCYLLNQLVLISYGYLVDGGMKLTYLKVIVTGLGLAGILYLLAVVFALIFEIPYWNWSRTMLKEGDPKEKSK